MNYSKNLNKKQIANRVILSWVVIALVAGLLGGFIGYGVHTHITTIDSAEVNQGVEWSKGENATEAKFEGLTVQYRIDTFFKMLKVTDDAEKKAGYLEQIEQLLKEGEQQ